MGCQLCKRRQGCVEAVTIALPKSLTVSPQLYANVALVEADFDQRGDDSGPCVDPFIDAGGNQDLDLFILVAVNLDAEVT